MKELIRLLKILCWIICIVLVASNLHPMALKQYINTLSISESQWNLILVTIEIILQAVIAFHSHWEQRQESKKCQYVFAIADATGCLDEYIAFIGSDYTSYSYVFNSTATSIAQPYYTINVQLSKNHCAQVSVPLILTVKRCPDGTQLEITNVSVRVENNGKLLRRHKVNKTNCSIDNTISSGMMFLLRLSLLCNFQLEPHLLYGRYFITMNLVFHDDHGRKIRKYIIIEIQSVNQQHIIKKVIARNSAMLRWLALLDNTIFRHNQLS